jgi:hypothetical protein
MRRTLFVTILKWNLSWYYVAVKKDTLQKGLPVPDEAAVRGAGSREKRRGPPDLATVKDFLRFCAAKGKGKIMEQITCDLLNSVTE